MRELTDLPPYPSQPAPSWKKIQSRNQKESLRQMVGLSLTYQTLVNGIQMALQMQGIATSMQYSYLTVAKRISTTSESISRKPHGLLQKSQVWKSKLQSCPEPSKFGHVIYGASNIQATDLITNLLTVAGKEKNRKIEITVQPQAEFQTDTEKKLFY